MRNSLCVLFAVLFFVGSFQIVSSSFGYGPERGGILASSLAGAGSLTGGATIEYKGVYPIPKLPGIGGMILFLEPDQQVPATFPYWQESHVSNGTADPLLFYQRLKIFDTADNLIDDYTVFVAVPPQTGVRMWAVSKTVTLADGDYYVTGELGYVDDNGDDQILDTASEEFSVMNL